MFSLRYEMKELKTDNFRCRHTTQAVVSAPGHSNNKKKTLFQLKNLCFVNYKTKIEGCVFELGSLFVEVFYKQSTFAVSRLQY